MGRTESPRKKFYGSVDFGEGGASKKEEVSLTGGSNVNWKGAAMSPLNVVGKRSGGASSPGESRGGSEPITVVGGGVEGGRSGGHLKSKFSNDNLEGFRDATPVT